MAANRKASRDTIRRSRRGRKAIAKSAPVKEPEKISRGKAAAPAAKTAVKPVKSKDAGLPAEKVAKSDALKSAVMKAAGASASVTPVKADVAPPSTAAASARLSGQQPGLVAVAVAETTLLAHEKKVQPAEKHLQDIPRYIDLAGPDMVPLSRKVSKVVWAFKPIDAITKTSIVGTTRIFAIPKGKEAEKKEHIELAIFSSRSGRLVVQTRTRTTLENDVPPPNLVQAAGGTLSEADVVGLRFENDLYDPQTIAKDKFLEPVILSPAPRYPFPSAHDPDGIMAFILGHAPVDFGTGGVAKMIHPELSGAGSKSLIDRERRFVLWGPADAVLAKITDDKSGFTVVLEIGDAPGSKRNLRLTYRATRGTPDKSPPAEAPDTVRMKLTEQSLTPAAPPIQAVPLVHLLLN